MIIRWDPNKEQENLRKHGFSLGLLEKILANEIDTIIDDRFDYGEDRFVTFGLIGLVLYVGVWTEQDDEVRSISVRKATPQEARHYG
jgi:uncharacterized DUF497 family protein